MLFSSVVFAEANNSNENQTPNTQTTSIQQVPYSSAGAEVMQKVYTKDEYVLWKCPSSAITRFPGQSITGKDYNYFVFKNGMFHLTVNENNKNDVFKFLTQE